METGLQGLDGVHPNDNGYEVMAEVWFQANQTNVVEAIKPTSSLRSPRSNRSHPRVSRSVCRLPARYGG